MSNRVNKLADAFLAIRDHGWELHEIGNRKIIVPPPADERRHWCAMWDEDGLPHWLPEYSEEIAEEEAIGVIPTEDIPIDFEE